MHLHARNDEWICKYFVVVQNETKPEFYSNSINSWMLMVHLNAANRRLILRIAIAHILDASSQRTGLHIKNRSLHRKAGTQCVPFSPAGEAIRVCVSPRTKNSIKMYYVRNDFDAYKEVCIVCTALSIPRHHHTQRTHTHTYRSRRHNILFHRQFGTTGASHSSVQM